LVIGVLNVTPDSFSDGGRWVDVDAAVEHAMAMVSDGADLVDVGGESTRPGAARVAADEEVRRVLPVVVALGRAGIPVSIDTMRSTVAAAAVKAGAVLVNDVSGGLADPRMFSVVADTGVAYVATHSRVRQGRDGVVSIAPPGQGGTPDRGYDVVADVRDELAARVAAMRAAGIADDQIVLDPGLGFSKSEERSWALLARLDELSDRYPVLVGASRKQFLGSLLHAARPLDRDAATVAVTTLAAAAGVWAVRVHEVRSSVDATRVAQAWTQARDPSAHDADAADDGDTR